MTRKLTIPVAPFVVPDSPVPISKGGHGASDPVGAVSNLGGIHVSRIGQPGGPVPLGVDRKIPVQYIDRATANVDGPSLLTINQVQNYIITNYDVYTTYTVQAITGSVSRTGDTITYTAPATAGQGGFIINGSTYNIAIGSAIVNNPSIVNPAVGSTNLGPIYSFSSSGFSVTGGSDTHQMSDWQIAYDSNFTNIALSSIGSISNLTTWTPSELPVASTLYVRVRHRGTALGWSNWSATRSFQTRSNYLPTSLESILTSSVPEESGNFGWHCALDSSSTRLAVVARLEDGTGPSNADKGALHIFKRTGNTWALEQRIPLDGTTGVNHAYKVAITANGDRVAISRGPVSTTSSRVQIFTRSGTTWTQEALLLPADDANPVEFGTYGLSFDSAGERLAITHTHSLVSGVNTGAVFVFKRTGTAWAQEAKLVHDTPASSGRFGRNVKLSSSGDRLICNSNIIPGSTRLTSATYVFRRSGVSWTKEAQLDSPSGLSIANAVIDSLGAKITQLFTESTGATIVKVREANRISTSWTNGTMSGDISLPPGRTTSLNVSMDSDTSINRIVTSGDGWVRLITRSGSVYTSQDTVSTDIDYNNACISGDGTRVATGGPLADPSGILNSGQVKIYA